MKQYVCPEVKLTTLSSEDIMTLSVDSGNGLYVEWSEIFSSSQDMGME